MENNKPKYVDDKINIKEQWKLYCFNKLYPRVMEIEQQEIKNYNKYIQNDVLYSERTKRLKMCEKFKEKIKKSALEKEFYLDGYDVEIILDRGMDYYFKFYVCI